MRLEVIEDSTVGLEKVAGSAMGIRAVAGSADFIFEACLRGLPLRRSGVVALLLMARSLSGIRVKVVAGLEVELDVVAGSAMGLTVVEDSTVGLDTIANSAVGLGEAEGSIVELMEVKGSAVEFNTAAGSTVGLAIVAGSAVGIRAVAGSPELELILQARLRGLPLRRSDVVVLLLLWLMAESLVGMRVKVVAGLAVELDVVAASAVEW